MLSHLDFVIFPDRCEVLEIVPSQRYFYPIFKNGTGSLKKQIKISNWKVKFNEQIKSLDSVDVVIREPMSRFASGISSYIEQTLEFNPELDRNTVIWFTKRYFSLDRHYTTQFAWLVNLARYMSPDAKINLFGMEELNTLTDLNVPHLREKNPELIKQFENLPAHEMYQRIDQVVFDCIGQSLTFAELVNKIKQADPTAYNQVIIRAQNILKPTYVVS